MRIDWDKSNERYFACGVDRGVLYPSTIPLNPVDKTNFIYNPTANEGNANGWITYGVATTVTALHGNGYWCFVVRKTAAGSQMGMRTTMTPGYGMTDRPAGTVVTISAEVRHAPGNTLTDFTIIARDDTNNDSAALTGVTAGAYTTSIPADNVWRQIFVTATVKAGRNLEGVYVTKSTAAAPLAETMLVRNVMINDGPLVPYFDGDTFDDGEYEYQWEGAPSASESTRRVARDLAIPWNGITGFDEGGTGSSSILYRDGVIYLADAEASDFSGVLTAFFYPDEFGPCIGMPQVADGLIADNQKPRRFDLCYRTLIGSGASGDMFGYQLHLVYKAVATIAPRNRRTMSSDVTPVEFSFDLVCTPTTLPGLRPSAHYILDTRTIGQSTLETLEGILYGTDTTGGRMPTPLELYDLMHFGDAITFVDHGDGTWTGSGAEKNVHMINADDWEILNVNGVDHGDGTFTLSDTP